MDENEMNNQLQFNTTRSFATPSPSKLRLFKNIWNNREDEENTTGIEHCVSDNKGDIDTTIRSKKRALFSMRSRKKIDKIANIGNANDQSLKDEEKEQLKNTQLKVDNLATEERQFNPFYTIKMSPIAKANGTFCDDNSSLNNSDSELSSEIITTISPQKVNDVRNEKALAIDFENKKEKIIPTSKTSDSANTTATLKVVSLYVGDLDKSITELNLHEFFASCRGLISVKIPRDSLSGNSLGYGYVNIENQILADQAIEKLNYTKLGNSEVRIMPSIRDKEERERAGTNIFFSNLPPNLTSRFFYDKFKEFGKILSCKYCEEKHTCFVNFDNKSNAYDVCKMFNQSEISGKTIYASIHILKKDRANFQAKGQLQKFLDITPVKSINNTQQFSIANSVNSAATTVVQSPNIKRNPQFFKLANRDINNCALNSSALKSGETKTNTQYSIFLRNLPLSIKEDVIRGLVEQYGDVTSVISRKVHKKNGIWALVALTNKESVERAVLGLNSVEIDGRQLFVTRAIPREQKAYARKEEIIAKRKRKILISGLQMDTHRGKLEEWCSQYGSIKSVEIYGTKRGLKKSAYGYIEIDSKEEANELINKLKNLAISCYEVLIEIPHTDANFESTKYPYSLNTDTPKPSLRYLANSTTSPPLFSFSYVDPTKMHQIADLNKTISFDKYNELNRRNSYIKKRGYSDENDSDLINKINEIIWELAVRMFTPIKSDNFSDGGFKSVNHNEILSETKVCSITDHMIKFFWAKNIEEMYQFLKINQCDINGNVLLPAHPLIERQLIQSAIYLGIISK